MTALNCKQPFILLPTRVWRAYRGGKLLDEIEEKPDPRDTNFPEDWIGSATRAINGGREEIEEGIATARSADGTEIRMDVLFQSHAEEVLGPAHLAAYGAQPQLLVKFIDSSVRLHIQAHPSVDWSLKHLNDNKGKTEAWWILGSRGDDPYVYFGFQRPPQPREWGRMMKEQDIDAMLSCFDRIPVEPGDVLLIKGGVPHAIGEGLFLLEIQEPTDYVVKSEYTLAGVTVSESTATMQRGVDRILDLFDYTTYPADRVKGTFGPRRRVVQKSSDGMEEVLLERPQTDRVEVRSLVVHTEVAPETDGRYSILVVLEGSGSVTANNITVPVGQWSKVFIPACITDLRCSGSLKLARCLPPKPDSPSHAEFPG